MEIFQKIWMVDWIIRNALAGQSLLNLNEESVTVFFNFDTSISFMYAEVVWNGMILNMW